MIKTIFAGSRFVIGLAVVATFLGAFALLVAATVSVVVTIWKEVENFDHSRYTANHVDHLAVQFIQLTDIILLGTVLLIVSLGLHQLFLDPDLPLPRPLQIHDLNELKRDLLTVTVVLLGVTFLGQVVDWKDDDQSILYLGVAVALVVMAIGFILWISPKPAKYDKSAEVVAQRNPGAPPESAQSHTQPPVS